VGQRRVDEQRPQRGEDHERPEPHAVGQRAADEGRGDDGEHQLEGHEQQRRDVQRQSRDRLAHVRETGEAEAAEESAPDIGAEGDRVAEHHPDNGDDRDADVVLHEHGQDALGPHHPRVEEGQAGGHEQNKSGAHKHPGCVAGVQS
jgi:hypothetical protein